MLDQSINQSTWVNTQVNTLVYTH